MSEIKPRDAVDFKIDVLSAAAGVYLSMFHGTFVDFETQTDGTDGIPAEVRELLDAGFFKFGRAMGGRLGPTSRLVITDDGHNAALRINSGAYRQTKERHEKRQVAEMNGRQVGSMRLHWDVVDGTHVYEDFPCLDDALEKAGEIHAKGEGKITRLENWFGEDACLADQLPAIAEMRASAQRIIAERAAMEANPLYGTF